MISKNYFSSAAADNSIRNLQSRHGAENSSGSRKKTGDEKELFFLELNKYFSRKINKKNSSNASRKSFFIAPDINNDASGKNISNFPNNCSTGNNPDRVFFSLSEPEHQYLQSINSVLFEINQPYLISTSGQNELIGNIDAGTGMKMPFLSSQATAIRTFLQRAAKIIAGHASIKKNILINLSSDFLGNISLGVKLSENEVHVSCSSSKKSAHLLLAEKKGLSDDLSRYGLKLASFNSTTGTE